MSMYNAKPGDIYRDANGNTYIVEWYCAEPMVELRKIDPAPIDDDAPDRVSGGVSGLMWEGFEKLVPEKKP